MLPMQRVAPLTAVVLFFGTACSSDDASPPGGGGPSGGSSIQAGTSGAAPQAGGSGTGGSANPAAGTSGTVPGAGATGGSGTAGGGGGAASAGAGSGGRSGAAGDGGGGSSAGAGGSAGVTQSEGCGKDRTLQNGAVTLSFNNVSRKYILRVPEGYDNKHPHRLVLAYAWSGGSAADVVNTNYFTFATQDSKGTIFAAPEATNGAGSWSKTDVDFTDAILAQLEGDLCIDKSRVFATGFSFGGAMAMALACTRADVFRGVAFFSGADLTMSCPATLTKPIAYYASQASEDGGGLSPTSPITGEKRQADFAAVNGCMPEPTSIDFPASGQPHRCTVYKGCSAGHPTEYCVFNGPHGWEPKDPGQAMSWDAPEAWKFITQF
jgi:poly(3-hydroxybutyrate) depolymerase